MASSLRTACASAALAMMMVPLALAGPQGAQVVGGSGSITQSGTNTTIDQASQRMAIDWQSYDVEAVLTFDQGGLLGVRVSKEILQDELGVEAAVTNSGQIKAEGGRVLMSGSVSQDVFSQAVNTDGIDERGHFVIDNKEVG